MTGEKKPFFYGYMVVAASCCIMLVTWGINRTFGVFLEPMIKEFGWSRAEVSAPFTLSMVMAGLLGIVTGRLCDRFGPRLVLTVCGVFVIFSYLLMSRVNSIWQLYLFFGVIGGIGMSGAQAPMMSTVARWFIKRRGLMSGIVLAGPGLGITITPLVASWLISTYGWRISSIVLGSIALLLIIPAAQLMKRDPAEIRQLPYGNGGQGGGAGLESEGLSFNETIRSGQFVMLAVAYFVAGLSIAVVLVHIVIHARGMGLEPMTAAGVLSATAGVSIAGRITGGGVADRIGSKLTAIIGFGLTLLGFLWLLVAKDVWMFYLFALIFGLGGWIIDPVISMVVAEQFGTKSHGVSFAAIASFGRIGGAVGPVLAGYIFDTFGSYQLVFWLCAGLNVIAAVLILLLKPTWFMKGQLTRIKA